MPAIHDHRAKRIAILSMLTSAFPLSIYIEAWNADQSAYPCGPITHCCSL
jgi:hypothetical protein